MRTGIVTSCTHSLWKDVCCERARLFEQGHPAWARVKTETSALALLVIGIAETVIHALGALLALWAGCIPSDAQWKRSCFAWIDTRAQGFEKTLVITCSCAVQLFTNLWEDGEDNTLQRAHVWLQKHLALGCLASDEWER